MGYGGWAMVGGGAIEHWGATFPLPSQAPMPPSPNCLKHTIQLLKS